MEAGSYPSPTRKREESAFQAGRPPHSLLALRAWMEGGCLSKPEAQARGIRHGWPAYPAVSLWKRAGLMPNTRLNAREN